MKIKKNRNRKKSWDKYYGSVKKIGIYNGEVTGTINKIHQDCAVEF